MVKPQLGKALQDASPAHPTPDHGPATASDPHAGLFFEVVSSTDPSLICGIIDDPKYDEDRQKMRAVLTAPLFKSSIYDFYKGTEHQRDLTDRRIRAFFKSGVFSVRRIKADPVHVMLAIETAALVDGSFAVRLGVHTILFVGAILALGTPAQHERFMDSANDYSTPGCFAMTELGHGSNVRMIGTTATYSTDRSAFDLHTPNDMSQKFWIGNVAHSARWSVVFARLVDGDNIDQGVHGFLVRLRDDNGQVLPGITIVDNGPKVGMNGIDNGRIWFEHVSVPRTDLLSRFGTVDVQGRYRSPGRTASERFANSLGALVGGRLTVTTGAMTAIRISLGVFGRFVMERRQFGRARQPEQPILGYLPVQQCLAMTAVNGVVYSAMMQQVVLLWQRTEHLNTHERKQLHLYAAALKVSVSRAAYVAVSRMRRLSGGAGYDARNMFGVMRADADINQTFEGDNALLLQQIAKELLVDLSYIIQDHGIVRMMVARAQTALQQKNPLASRKWDDTHLLSPEFQLAALCYRRDTLLRSLGMRLHTLVKSWRMSGFAAWNYCLDHVLALAKAHIQVIGFTVFDAHLRAMCKQLRVKHNPAKANTVLWRTRIDLGPVPTAPPGMDAASRAWQTIVLLRHMRSMYALWYINRNIGWYMMKKYLRQHKARGVRRLVLSLSREVAYYAVSIIQGIVPLLPNQAMQVPMVTGWAKANRHPRHKSAWKVVYGRGSQVPGKGDGDTYELSGKPRL